MSGAQMVQLETRVRSSQIVGQKVSLLKQLQMVEGLVTAVEAKVAPITIRGDDVIIGDPGISIANYAEEVKADLVVIPSHGYHGLHRLVLGSTTERVIRHCHSPVLVLRRHDAE